MPSYIGFRPQFNPVSLQEYLAVPTMIQQEFDTYEDKYNENLDKLAVLEGMTDESTRYLTDRYKDKLSNAADVIAGKSGSLSDLRSQINNARQYYRETAPRLTNAYNKRQAALKAQQDILLKDPSAVTTKVGNMQSFMDNPDQVFHSLSGDKIYADMINAGKLSAADLSRVENANLPGYLAKITGYTPQQQQEYANLVQQALYGKTDADRADADKALKNNPIYTQPYQVLSKYIEDNKFGVFDDSERAYVLNRALSGQLMGMTGHTDYMTDKQWARNAAFEDWKRKLNYKDSQQQKDANTSVLSKRPSEGTQTPEQKKLQKKVTEFKELIDYFKKTPGAWTETDNGEPVYQTDYMNSSAVQKASIGNSPLVNIYVPQSKIVKAADPKKQEWTRKRNEFKKLASELSVEINKQHPEAKLDFNFTVEPQLSPLGRQIGSKLIYNTNLDYYLDDLANLTSGYNYEVTPKEMRAMTQMIDVNSEIDGSNKWNKMIEDEDGRLKNSTLQSRKIPEALREGKVKLYIGRDLQHHFDYQGHTYTVKEEALDAELGATYFGDREGQLRLRAARDAGQFEYFNKGVYDFAKDYIKATRSRVPAAPETSSKFDDTFPYEDDSYLYEE